MGGHTAAEGRSTTPRHPGHRFVRARAGRRARKGDCRWLRRVRYQADRVRASCRNRSAPSRAPVVTLGPGGGSTKTHQRAPASIQNNSGLPQGPADPSTGRLLMRQTACVRRVPSWYDRRRQHSGEGAPMFAMGRREFVALLGGAAAWPDVARGQQPATPLVGFLDFRSAAENTRTVAEFRQGLAEAGYVEGRNV